MIQGVQVKTLKVIADERGLMEMLHKDDDLFAGFGQVYTLTPTSSGGPEGRLTPAWRPGRSR